MQVLSGGCWPPPTPWPSPWSRFDPELERLRRLRDHQEREEEKERLRDWLRRHGVPEDRICPRPFPVPLVPLPVVPLAPCPPARPGVHDILRRIR